jgi:hypothetical protein
VQVNVQRRETERQYGTRAKSYAHMKAQEDREAWQRPKLLMFTWVPCAGECTTARNEAAVDTRVKSYAHLKSEEDKEDWQRLQQHAAVFPNAHMVNVQGRETQRQYDMNSTLSYN